ncbi:MAG: RagB/SusD family nutrient uptake outer membrane protein [Muribaculaceae bacterium]|nr:RagB/SusD family nutrient uptake outer membrane protein [Muribaculaceae bacterium]
MKKIIFSILCLAGLMLPTSCNMNYEPIGSIVDEDALQTLSDCEKFRNGFYSAIRSLCVGGYIAYPELQTDQFIGTVSNGNNYGAINNGVIQSSDTDFEGVWGGLYGGIADCNFFFKYAPNVLKNKDVTLSEDDMKVYNKYMAECHFARAFLYYELLNYFCPSPANPAITMDQKYGLPIVTDYYPTAKKEAYPERSTLADTYKFIEKDLADAYDGLVEYEKYDDSSVTPMSPYVCSWTVRALQARLALLKGDNEAAVKYAKEVIGCKVYPITQRIAYAAMWTDDTSNEIIFRPISTATAAGIGSTGNYWNQNNDYDTWYIPVPDLAEVGVTKVYESMQDVRYQTFISERNLLVNGSFVKAPIFNKFPGNPALIYSGYVMLNMGKPFRISEQYLILAEASYNTGDEVTANSMLNEIRKNRIRNYEEATYSGTNLRDEIRKERLRELIGEGFRASDLRRWGEGFNRVVNSYMNYPQAAEIVTVAGNGVNYLPNDYRYTWPIPSAEIQVNPHMAGQQNPGYN